MYVFSHKMSPTFFHTQESHLASELVLAQWFYASLWKVLSLHYNTLRAVAGPAIDW